MSQRWQLSIDAPQGVLQAILPEFGWPSGSSWPGNYYESNVYSDNRSELVELAARLKERGYRTDLDRC